MIKHRHAALFAGRWSARVTAILRKNLIFEKVLKGKAIMVLPFPYSP